LLAEWLVDERHFPVAHVDLAATETIVIEAAKAFGMRESARFREMLLINGQRVDKVVFEYLNKGWLQTLGDPRDIPLERTGTGKARPVPPKVTLDGDPPKNAMLVGKRVYLRPEEKADARLATDWGRKETESFWDIGRHLISSVLLANWTDSHQEKDKPGWIWFTVCLRENDEPIGAVGLLDVDYVNLFAETGSFFHRPDYRGSGYGSEAKQLLLEYAFDVLGLHMIQSWVYFPNTRSAAALRKQGYTEAGQVNWLYSHKGRFDNFVVFDMLADEWRAMPRAEWDADSKA
jgi:RimJ/RimL family protein N-acetyltransferase